MKKTVIVSALVSIIVAVACVEAVTHIVLTNDQAFTVAGGRSLTGTYECSGAGTFNNCPLSSPTITGGTFAGITLTGTTTNSGTISGGSLTGITLKQGTIGQSFGASGDGVFLCAGSGAPYNDNNCRFNGNYEFNVGGVGSMQFDSGFSANGTNTISSGSLIVTTAATLDIRSGATLLVNSGAVITAVKTVRDSAGTGTCTLTFTKGILTATTC